MSFTLVFFCDQLVGSSGTDLGSLKHMGCLDGKNVVNRGDLTIGGQLGFMVEISHWQRGGYFMPITW